MQFVPTIIHDVIRIKPSVFEDVRGNFFETWHRVKFAEAGIDCSFVQDNHSGSHKGVLRGLHYQVKHAQGKLVRVLSGEIFAVAVDIRRNSPTFGKWVSERLDTDNRTQLWIPPGFAHGYYVMSDWAEYAYKCTDFYFPEFERTIIWNDVKINIDWPLSSDPILSQKDVQGKLLSDAEIYE